MKQIKTVILTIAAALTLSSCNYNGMVEREEAVSQAWSNVENQYQRRADLIPNLVNTVKGYAAHEQETLAQVIEARSKATSINIDAESLTPETLQAYQKAQGEIGNALGRLIALGEAYPDLKANENFKELQAQLEGTENRIAVERRNFNEVTRSYNTYLRKFPRNILSNIYGFDTKPYFEAEEGTQNAPKVEF